MVYIASPAGGASCARRLATPRLPRNARPPAARAANKPLQFVVFTLLGSLGAFCCPLQSAPERHFPTKGSKRDGTELALTSARGNTTIQPKKEQPRRPSRHRRH